MDVDASQNPYIPVLDNNFTPIEVEKAITIVKNKGYSGVATGLFRWIPLSLLVYITQILSLVFTSTLYPSVWCYNSLIVLFKSGSRALCGNYRGISVMDSLSKMYDTLLNIRLSSWISIDSAQAGAQKRRGCIEQILTLRLLIDYCKSQRVKLFIIFVDFQKAYDKVPRNKLLEFLKSRGCGRTMLLAIAALYRCTRYVLRSAIINARIGVRQGAPTSCLLFVLYIDNLVRLLKDSFQQDGFLGSLHALLLMDDTAIIATTREKSIDKFKVLLKFCDDSGMIINERKTKLMVINGTPADKTPISIGNISVDYSSHYSYTLGLISQTMGVCQRW